MGIIDMLYVGLHLWRNNLGSLKLFPPLNVTPYRACSNKPPSGRAGSSVRAE